MNKSNNGAERLLEKPDLARVLQPVLVEKALIKQLWLLELVRR